MGTVTIHETRYTEDEIAVYDDDGDAAYSVDPPCDDVSYVERGYWTGEIS